MIYLAVFACAISLGWLAAWRMGGAAERETMCLLTCVWAGTIVANAVTHSPAPVPFYAALDAMAVVWLFMHQLRNWQWITAGLFAAMLLTHFLFWSGSSAGLIIYEGRPYQDILAGLGYLQIFITGWASYERGRQRIGKSSLVGHWLLASDWVPRLSNHHRGHAGKR